MNETLKRLMSHFQNPTFLIVVGLTVAIILILYIAYPKPPVKDDAASKSDKPEKKRWRVVGRWIGTIVIIGLCVVAVTVVGPKYGFLWAAVIMAVALTIFYLVTGKLGLMLVTVTLLIIVWAGYNAYTEKRESRAKVIDANADIWDAMNTPRNFGIIGSYPNWGCTFEARYKGGRQEVYEPGSSRFAWITKWSDNTLIWRKDHPDETYMVFTYVGYLQTGNGVWVWYNSRGSEMERGTFSLATSLQGPRHCMGIDGSVSFSTNTGGPREEYSFRLWPNQDYGSYLLDLQNRR